MSEIDWNSVPPPTDWDSVPPPQASEVGGLSVVPDAPPLKTSVPLKFPDNPEDFEQYENPDYLSRSMDRLDENLANARNGAASGSAQDARRALALSREIGVGEGAIHGNEKAYEEIQERETLHRKLTQMPQLAEYMAKSPQHAAAVKDEIDNWSALEYLFGKYHSDPAQVAARNTALQAGEADPGLPGSDYDAPGWLLALGKSFYSTGTSIQTWAQKKFQPDLSPEEAKAMGLQLAPDKLKGDIARRRDISNVKVPGDNDKILKHVNSIIGMTPIIIASHIHPAAAFGLMYPEIAGRTYEDMRLAGWDHKDSQFASEITGFTTAAVGAGLGYVTKANLLPRASLGYWIPNTVSRSIVEKPTIWRAALDLGKNFFSAMAANIAMAGAEEHMRESFASARSGKPYDYSKVASATWQAAQAWPEMLALAVMPAYAAHQKRLAQEPGKVIDQVLDKVQIEEQKRNEKIYDDYEEKGHALRSLADAARLQAAVDALKGSEFAKTNPEDARDLARQLTKPRASQTVFVDPSALDGLSPESRAQLGPVDSTGAVGLVDFLLHPEAEGLLPKAAGEIDLLQAGEAGRVDFTREPPPDIAPASDVPRRPEGRDALRHWADDAASRMPSEGLAAMAEEHARRASQAAQEAFAAQTQATEHAKAGRDASEAERLARDATRRAHSSSALADAARRAQKETQRLSKELNPISREDAWYAGETYGEAWDALREMLGAEKKRGYAAPDLTDMHDNLAAEGKLPQDWDTRTVNKLMSQVHEPWMLSLGEIKEVHKAVNQIADAAKAEGEVLLNGVRIAKDMILADLTDHFKNLGDVPLAQQRTQHSPKAIAQAEGLLDKISNGTASMRASGLQPHTLMFKQGKVGDALWFDRFIPSVAREERIWRGVSESLRGIADNTPADILASGLDPIQGPDGKMMVRSDAWHIALHMGTQGTDIKLARGYRVSPDVLHEWVQANLGKDSGQAHAVAGKILEPHWKEFDKIWGEYEQHFRERGLAPPERLIPQKLTIRGKEFSGGYGGKLRWDNFAGDKQVLHPGSLEELIGTHDQGPSTDDGHLNERVDNAGGRPVVGWEKVIGSVRKEIHDIAMRPFIEDAHKIYSDNAIRDLLARKMGGDQLDAIYKPGDKTDWLHTVADGSVADIHSAHWFTKSMMNLQGRAAYSAFSGNFRVMAAQPLSHIPAAMFALSLGPQHIAAGIIKAFSPDARTRAHAMSDVLRLRYDDYQRRAEELNRQLTGVEPGSGVLRTLPDHINWAAWRETDAFVSHAIWEAEYSRSGDVRKADKAVTKMMPATDLYGQSKFVRDRSVAGFTFLVRNFPNTLANIAALNQWEARVSGSKMGQVKAAAMTTAMIMSIEVLGKALVIQGGPSDKEKKPGEWWTLHAAASLGYPWQLSEVLQAGYHASQGDVKGVADSMSMVTPPALSFATNTFKDVAKFLGDGDQEAALKAGARLLGVGLKSPLPMKAYDLSNAARNAESPKDAAKKAMGYRE